MKTLTHKQTIKTAMTNCIGATEAITFGCVEGDIEHCKMIKEMFSMSAFDWETQRAAKTFTHKTYAYGVKKYACVLTDDPIEAKDAESKRRKEELENAVLIENGEIIEAHGRKYKAAYKGLQYSNPIHFELVV